MEQHKRLGAGTEAFRPPLDDGIEAYFAKAWEFTQTFYGDQVRQISSVILSEVTPEHFFREYVWVVHATGFSAKAVSSFMGRLLNAYGPWETMAATAAEIVVERVRQVVNNPQKIQSVHAMSGWMSAGVKAYGWPRYRDDHLSSPERLARLPYIGKITCYHLGRNIGLLDCVKPDLHLIRMAKHWGFKDCVEMCKAAQRDHERKTGDTVPLGLIDLALWYSASSFGSLELRRDGER